MLCTIIHETSSKGMNKMIIDDWREQKGVDVIAIFDSKGNIRPLYVKVEGYDAIKIESVTDVKNTTFEQIDFTCIYIREGMKKKFKMCYNSRTHLWTIPGMKYQSES